MDNKTSLLNTYHVKSAVSLSFNQCELAVAEGFTYHFYNMGYHSVWGQSTVLLKDSSSLFVKFRQFLKEPSRGLLSVGIRWVPDIVGSLHNCYLVHHCLEAFMAI